MFLHHSEFWDGVSVFITKQDGKDA